MKQFLLLLTCLLTLNIFCAQAQKADTLGATGNLKMAAEKMAQLFADKNYSEYMGYMHPKLVKMMGGTENVLSVLKKSMRQMETQGFVFKSIKIGEPAAVVNSGPELQSIIPQTIELTTEKGVLRAVSYLLCISKDKGLHWYFIDTSNKSLDDLRKNGFENLSKKLTIPAKEPPVLLKD